MSSKGLPRLGIFLAVHILILLAAPTPARTTGREPESPQKTFGPTALTVEDLTGSLTPEDLANALVGAGISVSNVSYTGADVAAGSFTGGNSIIGFDSGIILSSGAVVDVVGPNQLDGVSTLNGTAGDPDLDLLAGFVTYDAAILEFDFVPNGDFISFQFVFASDEYNEWVNSQFNDVFGFFINSVNCALIEGDPIAINTVNNGNPEGDLTPSHPEFYINNDLNNGGGTIDTEMDGLTEVLTCSTSVIPNQTNHLKLAIADSSDEILDAAVFIQAESVTVERRPVILLPGLGGSTNWSCFFKNTKCDDESEWDWMPTAESFYEPLINRLAEASYTEANGYFNVFWYDWTQPLATNIERLKERIGQVTDNTATTEVDLIGHSMGGLLGRAYIQSDSYENNVAHLVTLGSPHRGAAKTYPYWEGGYLYQVDFDGMWKVALNSLLIYFKFKDKTLTTMGVIREEAPGLQDILPTEDYLYDHETNLVRLESEMEHRNIYLATLNQSLATLSERTSLATFVSNDVSNTAVRFYVRDRHFWEWPKWDDGVPIWDRQDEFVTDQGDGTVPAISARLDAPQVTVKEFFGVVHSNMAGNNDVINAILAFLEISVAPPVQDLIPLSALAFSINGPADITVTDPLGRMAGADAATITSTNGASSIPDVEYVSFPDDPFKMIIVPGPIEGDYNVEVTGSGNGSYALGAFDSAELVPEVVEDVTEIWDTLETQTEIGANTPYVVSYTEEVTDETRLIAVTPVVEMPLYMNSTVVRGRALPSYMVSIHDADSNTFLGSGTVNEDGTFAITVSTPLALEQRVYIIVNGVVSIPVTVEAFGIVYLPSIIR